MSLILFITMSIAKLSLADEYQQNVEKQLLAVDGFKIKEIARPISEGEELTYRYIVKDGNLQKCSTTIVFLPGGPGGAASFLEADHYRKSYPKDCKLILFDPRGAGLNLLFGLKDIRSLSVDSLTEDFLEALKKESVKDYIIHGHSFGTVTATVLGHKIKKHTSLPMPRKIVLEGVVGYAEEYDDKNPFANFNDEEVAKDLIAQLPLKLREMVNKKINDCHKDKRFYVYYALLELRSKYPSSPQFYEASKKFISEETINECESPWGDSLKDFGLESSMSPVHRNLYLSFELSNIINLREIYNFKSLPANTKFFLELTEEWIFTPDWNKPYDSSNYDLSGIPIVYLQGFNDTQTHLQQATYHFGRQRGAAEYFIFRALGHNTLLQTECSQAFFSQVVGLSKNFEKCLVDNKITFQKKQR